MQSEGKNGKWNDHPTNQIQQVQIKCSAVNNVIPLEGEFEVFQHAVARSSSLRKIFLYDENLSAS